MPKLSFEDYIHQYGAYLETHKEDYDIPTMKISIYAYQCKFKWFNNVLRFLGFHGKLLGLYQSCYIPMIGWLADEFIIIYDEQFGQYLRSNGFNTKIADYWRNP